MVQSVKAPCTNRKTLVVFFEPLDDSVFPLETDLLGRQMSLADKTSSWHAPPGRPLLEIC